MYEQQNAIYDDCERGDYFITEEKFRALQSFEVKPGDLIISCSGTVGRIAIIPEWASPGIINQALLKLSLDQSLVLNSYFRSCIAEAGADRPETLPRKAACEGHLVPTEAELARQEGRSYEPATKLLARILKERRAQWESIQRAKYQAAGKMPKDDKWKERYPKPATPELPSGGELFHPLPEGWTWTSPSQLATGENYALAIGPFGSNLKVSDYTSSGVPLA